jgi:hypothetical protein
MDVWVFHVRLLIHSETQVSAPKIIIVVKENRVQATGSYS